MIKEKRGVNKKGLSPVIATVLLIALVIIIALIIFLWARRFVGEACQKQGEAGENACSKIVLDARYSATDVYLTNNGNLPISGVKVKILSEGSEYSETLDEAILGAGQSGNFPVSGLDISEEVKIVPVILGETSVGECEYVCEDNKITAEPV